MHWNAFKYELNALKNACYGAFLNKMKYVPLMVNVNFIPCFRLALCVCNVMNKKKTLCLLHIKHLFKIFKKVLRDTFLKFRIKRGGGFEIFESMKKVYKAKNILIEKKSVLKMSVPDFLLKLLVKIIKF